jgi:Protein of unknown function (DUF3303)
MLSHYDSQCGIGAKLMPITRYMIVERFRDKDAAAVYRRFRDHGRMAPAGLEYIASWVDDKFELCFQIMEASDRSLNEEWIKNWSDLVDFEIYPILTSAEAMETIAPKL